MELGVVHALGIMQCECVHGVSCSS
jgi:hypothetical protein